MNRPFPKLFIGLATAMLLGVSGAQTPSSTSVIGFYKFDVPAGKSMWTCAFVTKKDFQGLATSVDGTGSGASATTMITQTGASWSANQFQTSEFPATQSSHYIEILSGSDAGTVADVTENGANTLTVSGNFGVSPFSYAVHKHTTLASVFLSAGLSEFEDEVIVYDDQGVSTSYMFDGTLGAEHMVDTATNSIISDNVPLYPSQGFLLSTLTPKTLTFGGGEVSYVKSTSTKIRLKAGAVNLVGVMNPIVAATPLGGAVGSNERVAIGSTGLATSGFSEYEDQILVYGLVNGGLRSTGTYYTDNSTNDVVLDDGTPVSSTVFIPNGSAFLVRPVISNATYTQPVTHP